MIERWWYAHTPEALWSWADLRLSVRRWPSYWPFNVEPPRYRNPLLVWIAPSWWSYLLDGLSRLPWWSEAGDPSKTRRFVCRMRGHPCGIMFFNFNPEATEPDGRCKNCREDIG